MKAKENNHVYRSTDLHHRHVVLSLAGIGSGFAVFYGLLTDKRLEAWNRFFLVTTAATSVTGSFSRWTVSCRRTPLVSRRYWSWRWLRRRATATAWRGHGAGCTWSAPSQPCI